MRAIKRYYDAISVDIDHIYQTSMREAEEKLIKAHVPTGRLLDIGCGSGLYVELLSGNGSDVTAMDIAPKLASLTHMRTAAKVVVGEAQRLPFSPSTFDGAVAIFGALNHVKSLNKALADVARVLKKHGVFLFTAANKWNANWYLKQLRKNGASAVLESLSKKDGIIRRSVGDTWYDVWTRFYSAGELRRAAEKHFAVKASFGLTKNGRIYGFPRSYFAEYIGFSLVKR